MSWTFGDSQDFLSQLLGDPNISSDDMFPTSQRNRELNNGELQFARDAKNLREYATGSVSSNQIAVPSDWLGTHTLIIDNKVISNDREIAIQDWERYYNYTGSPPYYYFWEYSGTRYLKLLGSATTYNLYYWKRPTTALSNSTDVSLHPEEYRKAPAYFAACELMKQIGKHQEASLFYESYQEYILRANTDIGKSYINKEYARPDIGITDTSVQQDIVGGGYQWR